MNQSLKVLVMTAVAAERDAMLRGLGDEGGSGRFDVQLAGVGPAAAAAHTALALSRAEYGLVISAGIAGGFAGRAEVGALVVASEIVCADLGVETGEGFASVDELGFGSSRIAVDGRLADDLTARLSAAGLPVSSGPIVTVSTATGTAATAATLAERVPGAAAEGMEGFGVAAAARACGVPVLELRAVSNAVGPRDRASWRIKEALDMLAAACPALREAAQ
ncbi:MAG: futalosine hydrolase [Paenibacillus sp.]|nr:futalosine hydrolase [Paenibacillus sp.]